MTHLTNGSGAVLEKYRYDAFGGPTTYNASNTQLSATAYNNRFLFTGREYDSTFSFYEYRARAYNPTLGRFMSEDPKLFDAGDYNLYRYCHNDPLDMTDPMGLDILGYSSFGDYAHDVGQVFIGETKGAGNILSLGLYQPSYANTNQRLGGYVGQGLAVAGLAAATKAGPREAPITERPTLESPRNPYGSRGKPDHQETVSRLQDKARQQTGPGEPVLREKQLQGHDSNRRPDVQIVDRNGVTRKVFEAERRLRLHLFLRRHG